VTTRCWRARVPPHGVEATAASCAVAQVNNGPEWLHIWTSSIHDIVGESGRTGGSA